MYLFIDVSQILVVHIGIFSWNFDYSGIFNLLVGCFSTESFIGTIIKDWDEEEGDVLSGNFVVRK